MDEIKKSEVMFFIRTLFLNEYSAFEIHELLVNAHGDDVLSLRRIQTIVKEFRDGVRETHVRSPGSGRPKTSTSDANVERVRQLIENDCGLSSKDISREIGIPYRSVYRILVVNLKKKCLHGRWVPHRLTEAHKLQRIEEAGTILAMLNRRIAHRLVVTDEKWIYLRDCVPTSKQHFYVDGAGDRPQVVKRSTMDKKVMVIMASNFHGNAYFELLREGTMDGERYKLFLNSMLTHYASLQTPIQPENVLLMHDNARPHVARLVNDWLDTKNVIRVKQPPYSPDFNLMDRFVFRNFEVFRREEDYEDMDAVNDAVADYVSTFTQIVFMRQKEKLMADLQKIIELNGDYI